MKDILISIKPKYCELITSGKKKIEMRKSCPQLKPPFKCHIYCSLLNPKTDWDWQYKPHLFSKSGQLKWIDGAFNSTFGWELAHQKIIGEFVCDKIDVTYPILIPNTDVALYTDEWVLGSKAKDACLTLKDISEYGKGKPVYGWHISNLKIHDKPKDLKEFKGLCRQSCLNCKYVKYFDIACDERGTYKLTRPPQSWCYVEV